jgi:hypothetical protein
MRARAKTAERGAGESHFPTTNQALASAPSKATEAADKTLQQTAGQPVA